MDIMLKLESSVKPQKVMKQLIVEGEGYKANAKKWVTIQKTHLDSLKLGYPTFIKCFA